MNMMAARWLRGWALSDEWAVGKATYLQDRTVRLRREDLLSYRTEQKLQNITEEGKNKVEESEIIKSNINHKMLRGQQVGSE